MAKRLNTQQTTEAQLVNLPQPVVNEINQRMQNTGRFGYCSKANN